MLKRFSILSLLASLLLCFQGCSDDIFDIRPDNGGQDNEPGLHIYLPSDMTTRAMSESAPTEAEKKISTVYLFAYDGATANAEPVQVFELKNGVAGANGYTKYTISNLKKDKNYFFYVVANIFDSDEESALKSSYPSKGNLAGKILDYTTDMFAYPNTTAGAANGLPMSCDNGNIYYYGDNSEKKYFNSNQAQLFDGSKTLYADLVFCVAKVTVNVEKPAGDYCALTEANLFNYAKTFPILATSSELATSGTAGLQLKGNNLKGTDHTYTFYVPENTFSKREESKLNIKFKDENDTELTVDIPLGEKDGNNVRTLDRGCHYEYLLNSKGNITLNVYSWINNALDAEVGGPFYLRISASKIASMKSGVKYSLTFDTDVTAENFSLEAPKYVDSNNNEYPAFIFTKSFKEGKFTVQINDAIPLSVWKDETKSKALRYFHVVANNLKKRVDIDEIEAEPSFTVNPQTIVVDLRELIAGGYSKYLYNVEYASNIGYVESTWGSARWKDASGDVLTSYSGAEIANTFVPTVATDATSSGVDGVNVYQLDEGIPFYADRKYLEVTYEVKMPADASADDITLFNKLKQNNGHKKTVRYTVIPYTSNYIIHFHSEANTDSWTKPHIYAYQCLELPVDLKGDNAKYAGKTVGDKNGDNWYAALKYCFSTGFAFKGWKGYGGANVNDPTAAGNYGKDYGGFFQFSGVNYLPNTGNVSGSKLNTDRYEWFGFNNAHYKNLTAAGQSICTDEHCSPTWNPTPGESPNKVQLWPGIIMQKETIDGKTWWKYELSGVAEPGKTLLMWANGHTGSDYRFPKGEAVGVPLFDYEDKEGWFVLKENGGDDYTTNHFYDENPYAGNGEEDDPIVVEDPMPYRIYVPKSGTTQLYLWFNGKSHFVGVGKDALTEVGDYYYYDFDHPGDLDEELNISLVGGSDKKLTLKLKDFSMVEDRYTAYTDANGNATAGKPEIKVVNYVTVYYKAHNGKVPEFNNGDVYISYSGGTDGMSGNNNIKMNLETIGSDRWWKYEVPDDNTKLRFCSYSNSENCRSSEYSSLQSDIQKSTSKVLYYQLNDSWNIESINSNMQNANVIVTGGFNGWPQSGGVKSFESVTTQYNVSIGTNDFKVIEEKNGNKTWYSNGSSINLNTWTKIGNESGNMKVNGASEGESYTVEWNSATKQIRISKASPSARRRERKNNINRK